MKRKHLAAILFVAVFIGAYLFICFMIPGMRIKLDAEPMVYFVESIMHMVFFKSIVSLIAALIAGVIPLMICKKD